jgi:hypothetical protein
MLTSALGSDIESSPRLWSDVGLADRIPGTKALIFQDLIRTIFQRLSSSILNGSFDGLLPIRLNHSCIFANLVYLLSCFILPAFCPSSCSDVCYKLIDNSMCTCSPARSSMLHFVFLVICIITSRELIFIDLLVPDCS